MEEKKGKKLSYEELERVAGELHQQNQQLSARMQQMNMANVFRRIDYLFKVLELKECFNAEFVINCSEEITEFLTPPEEEKPETEEGKEE